MKKILIACAKADFGTLKVQLARTLVQAATDEVEVQTSEQIDWQEVMRTEGSWEASYRWAARAFDAMVLVPTDCGALGKGQYTLWQNFVQAGKPVSVLVGAKLQRVRTCTPSPEKDWKQNFASIECSDAAS